jgi:hypothetical protein
VKISGSEGKTCKQRGEWAELCFMAGAADRGFNVSKPHGDSASYDVGVEDNGRFMRVQVKSTTFRRKGSFTCNIVGPKRRRYASGKLDFLRCIWCRSMFGTLFRLRSWRAIFR